jgi:hypothetical protein
VIDAWMLFQVSLFPPCAGDSPTKRESHHAPEQMFFLALQGAGLVGAEGLELNATLAPGEDMPNTNPDEL